jgi:hypothetical protein
MLATPEITLPTIMAAATVTGIDHHLNTDYSDTNSTTARTAYDIGVAPDVEYDALISTTSPDTHDAINVENDDAPSAFDVTTLPALVRPPTETDTPRALDVVAGVSIHADADTR